LYRVHSWITQIIRQWVPNCRSGDRKSPSPEGAALNTWNRQLMTSGRSQMVTTGNCGNWHTVVGKICWSPMPETPMDCDSQLVLHPLRNTQPVQIIMHQPWQTMLAFPGPCDQTRRSILNPLQPVRDLLLCRSQSRVTKVNLRCDKGMFKCSVFSVSKWSKLFIYSAIQLQVRNKLSVQVFSVQHEQMKQQTKLTWPGITAKKLHLCVCKSLHVWY